MEVDGEVGEGGHVLEVGDEEEGVEVGGIGEYEFFEVCGVDVGLVGSENEGGREEEGKVGF